MRKLHSSFKEERRHAQHLSPTTEKQKSEDKLELPEKM